MKVYETWLEEDRQAIQDIFDRPDSTPRLLSRALELCYLHQDIKKRGDAALREFLQLPVDHPFLVPLADIFSIQPTAADALRHIKATIENFYRSQPMPSWFQTSSSGVVLGQKHSRLERVAICLPGDPRFAASYALLYGIPARLAGVPELYLNTPVLPKGADALRLSYAAILLEGARITHLPEVPAIFAYSVGTRSLPRVDKILGIAGDEGQAAALVVSRNTGVHIGDVAAETVILADGSVDVDQLTLDLLARVELEPHRLLLVITSSMVLASEIAEKMARLKRKLGATAAGPIAALEEVAVVITTQDIDEAIGLLNRYPPKELILETADPWSLLTRLEGGGSIQLGAISPPLLRRLSPSIQGMLPAGATSRFASPPALADYVRTTSLVYQTRPFPPEIMRLMEDTVPPESLPICWKSVEARKNKASDLEE